MSSLIESSPLLTSLNRSEIQHSWILQSEQIPPFDSSTEVTNETNRVIIQNSLTSSPLLPVLCETKPHRDLLESYIFSNFLWLLICTINKNLNLSQMHSHYFKIRSVPKISSFAFQSVWLVHLVTQSSWEAIVVIGSGCTIARHLLCSAQSDSAYEHLK